LLVGLLKGGDPGLFQDAVLRVVRDHGAYICRSDVARCALQVLRLVRVYCRCGLKLFDGRASVPRCDETVEMAAVMTASADCALVAPAVGLAPLLLQNAFQSKDRTEKSGLP